MLSLVTGEYYYLYFVIHLPMEYLSYLNGVHRLTMGLDSIHRI